MTRQTILVLGADGYIGYPLTCELAAAGYHVVAVDNLSKRNRVESVTPIAGALDRFDRLERTDFYPLDITNTASLEQLITDYQPEAVVNLAQIPSAPYSMRDAEAAWETQQNNIKGSLNVVWALKDHAPDAHLIQLATMGEYPLGDIPEGFVDGQPAPKDPGSFYHASKVNATVNTLFASQTWDLPVTEIYQGIVHGTYPGPGHTRFTVDDEWGTVMNRFVAQAVADLPLTVYGTGNQKRAVLSLTDCLNCIQLLLENPPDGYRPVNQFHEALRVREMAAMVVAETGAEIEYIDNPRVEDESAHEYNPDRTTLDALGYDFQRGFADQLPHTLETIKQYRDNIPTDRLRPSVTWR